jgi:hypothetical protein
MSDWEFSKDRVKVVPGELRIEAKSWHDRADTMLTLAAGARNESLLKSAFAVTVDPVLTAAMATDLSGAYNRMQDWLASLLQQGADQFDAMGNALVKIADAYVHVDANSALDFDEIAKRE